MQFSLLSLLIESVLLLHVLILQLREYQESWTRPTLIYLLQLRPELIQVNLSSYHQPSGENQRFWKGFTFVYATHVALLMIKERLSISASTGLFSTTKGGTSDPTRSDRDKGRAGDFGAARRGDYGIALLKRREGGGRKVNGVDIIWFKWAWKAQNGRLGVSLKKDLMKLKIDVCQWIN